MAQLKGAYAIAVVDTEHENEVIVAREGSPLVLWVLARPSRAPIRQHFGKSRILLFISKMATLPY